MSKKLPTLKHFPSTEYGMFVNKYFYFEKGKISYYHASSDEQIMKFDRPNIPFQSRLKFVETLSIDKSNKILWEDEEGYNYVMFFSDLDDVLKQGLKPGGYIEGNWIVRKAGTSYGVILLAKEYDIVKI